MTGRIFITGDMHGTFSPLFGLRERQALHRADILLIAGDAGYVWDGDYPCRVETLEQLFPGTVAFIDGNHENHAILNSLEVREWMGGRVHRVGERVYHLLRGEVYDLYGSRIFTFGGARSTDKDQREEGESWWPGEEPSAAELAYGAQQLRAHRDTLHYVVTHESPLSARDALSRQKRIDPDYRLPAVLEEWYRQVSRGPLFRKWYFGHMHRDQAVAPDLRGIHDHILLLGEETPIRWA